MLSTELVLLLAIYAFVILGVFLGEDGPVGTYKKSSPRLAARIERNVATGRLFVSAKKSGVRWVKPE